MSTFGSQRSKPTYNQYLNASYEELLERINTNPSGMQSEGEVIIAAIHAKTVLYMENIAKSSAKSAKYMLGIAILTFIATVISIAVTAWTLQIPS